MESFRQVLLATMELRDRSSELLRALFKKLRAKKTVFTCMDTLHVHTQEMVYAFQWTSLRSQFTTFSVSRHRVCSCSITRERCSAISIHRFLQRCQTNSHEKFQRREVHTTKEKVFAKACACPNFFCSLQVRALLVAMARICAHLCTSKLVIDTCSRYS